MTPTIHYCASWSQMPPGVVDMREILSTKISDLPAPGALCYVKHKRQTASFIGAVQLLAQFGVISIGREYKPPLNTVADIHGLTIKMIKTALNQFKTPHPLLITDLHVAAALAGRAPVYVISSTLPPQWLLTECRRNGVVIALKERRITP